jgi:hypothetical protein
MSVADAFIKLKTGYFNSHTNKFVDHDHFIYINVSDISRVWERNAGIWCIALKSEPHHQSWMLTGYAVPNLLDVVRLVE